MKSWKYETSRGLDNVEVSSYKEVSSYEIWICYDNKCHV